MDEKCSKFIQAFRKLTQKYWEYKLGKIPNLGDISPSPISYKLNHSLQLSETLKINCTKNDAGIFSSLDLKRTSYLVHVIFILLLKCRVTKVSCNS